MLPASGRSTQSGHVWSLFLALGDSCTVNGQCQRLARKVDESVVYRSKWYDGTWQDWVANIRRDELDQVRPQSPSRVADPAPGTRSCRVVRTWYFRLGRNRLSAAWQFANPQVCRSDWNWIIADGAVENGDRPSRNVSLFKLRNPRPHGACGKPRPAPVTPLRLVTTTPGRIRLLACIFSCSQLLLRL